MENEKKVLELNLDDILPNRFQPRIKFDESAINELAESIKEHGVIQPIIVREIGDKYEIIAGERRYKASVLAGKTTIPAIITNLSDRESAEVALIENVQREDLSPIEEAVSYRKILDMGLTQEQLADKLDRNQSTIANKLRLLNLEEEVQEALLNNKISERHARSLLRLHDKNAQVDMLNRIINERLTVRKTDEEIDKLLNGNANEENNEESGIWLSNTDNMGEIMNNDEKINFNIPSEPIINDVEETPINFNNNDNYTVPEIVIDDVKEPNSFMPNHEENIESLLNDIDFDSTLNSSINDENINFNFNSENPGFLDIDKIENQAKDIYVDKPLPNINDLLQVNNQEMVYEPFVGETKTEDNDIPHIDNNVNNAENFWPSKFFNFGNEEVTNNNTTQPNNDIFSGESFTNNFDYNSLPPVNENINTDFSKDLDENISFENNDIETNNYSSDINFNEPVAPIPEVTDLGIETESMNFDDIIVSDNIAEVNKENEIVLPTDFEVKDEVFGNDLRSVINVIRECAKKIEQMGFVVDTEELDFENEYRVTFTVEK